MIYACHDNQRRGNKTKGITDEDHGGPECVECARSLAKLVAGVVARPWREGWTG